MFFDFSVLIKYLLEGLAVAIAAFYIPRRSVDLKEIALIALTAAAVFSILDQFSPPIGLGARQGAGFGIGLNQVGFGNPGHYNGFGYLGDYPYDLYGGQDAADPRLSCTCEVDAEYLRGQICKVHTPPNSESSVSTTETATQDVTTPSTTGTTNQTLQTPNQTLQTSNQTLQTSNQTLQTPLGPIQRINIVGPAGQSISTYPSAQAAGGIQGFDGFTKAF